MQTGRTVTHNMNQDELQCKVEPSSITKVSAQTPSEINNLWKIYKMEISLCQGRT
jgi:hypothetical protein